MEYSPSKEAPGWAWTSGQPDTGACFHNVSSSLPVGKAIRGHLEAHSLEGALGWGCTLTLWTPQQHPSLGASCAPDVCKHWMRPAL